VIYSLTEISNRTPLPDMKRNVLKEKIKETVKFHPDIKKAEDYYFILTK